MGYIVLEKTTKEYDDIEYKVEEDMELDKEKSYNSIIGNI